MKPRGILESALYVNDLPEAKRFYESLFDLELIVFEADRHCFFKSANGMLLLFDPKATTEADAGDAAPPHGATGPGHLAFGIFRDELESWRRHLEEHQVPIEREVTWPNKAHSIYFRDPANNCLELATVDLWRFTEEEFV